MKYKLKFTFRISLLLFGIIACTDNSYKGYSPPIEIENDNPMPVILSLGSTNYSITTKGAGAIEGKENDEVWGNAEIYIYSFMRNTETNFTQTMEPALIGEEWSRPACLIDGSKDEPPSELGKKAKVKIENRSIEWQNDATIYYPTSSDAYNFYGYYIDDIIPEKIIRTNNSISFDIEIDGSQDIMTSIAALTDEQEKSLTHTYSESEQGIIRNSLYSSYTARRNIQPIMNFRHHLTRLKFQIFGSRPESKDVCVKSIEISSQTKGTFTVVDKVASNIGIEFHGENKTLYLKDPKGMPLSDYYPVYKEEEKGMAVYDRTPVTVGESLLLPPATEYNFNLVLSQLIRDKEGNLVLDENGKPKEDVLVTPSSLKIGNNEIFQPGREYIVRIAVYGIEEIVIIIEPGEWLSGGNIILNPETDYFH